MATYIFRRILSTIPVIGVVAIFVFSLLYFAPGDPAALIAGDQASVQDVGKIRELLGLNRGFVVQFVDWFLSICQGDLGTSLFAGQSVLSLIAQRIEPTLSLMVLATLISVVIGVPLGVLAASREGTLVDRLVMMFVVFGFSVPGFIVGYLLAYVFGLKLRLTPVQGYSELHRGIFLWLDSLILPSFALAFSYIALIARITRTAMLETLHQDFVRTARAKGLSNWSVLFVHALKNAAVPIVTVVGIGVAMLIGGAVVTETVFGIPGLGRLTVDAILRRDYPVIQGVVLLFSLSYVFVNLIIDIMYIYLDPRIRF
ncbi:ABC transporter permease (plasmid) [Mesorhizobium sp. ORM8.1]